MFDSQILSKKKKKKENNLSIISTAAELWHTSQLITFVNSYLNGVITDMAHRSEYKCSRKSLPLNVQLNF